MKDTYKTINETSPVSFFKEKGSKFYGYAFPILKEEEVKLFLLKLKKQHAAAGHFCYAWQLGQDASYFRVNDDGEPNNSAGMPIYGQIQSFGVTNVLVVSVRYFGGTKLGVGGLVQAYKHSAQITLEGASIVEKTINLHYELTFTYDLMNKVMRIIKEKNIDLLHQELGLSCSCTIAVRKSENTEVLNRFKALYKLKIELKAD